MIDQPDTITCMKAQSTTERRNAEALRRIEHCRETREAELDLSGIGLEKIPEELAGLAWLKRLRISDCPITMLPGSIGNLASLEDLYINLLLYFLSRNESLPGLCNTCSYGYIPQKDQKLY